MRHGTIKNNFLNSFESEDEYKNGDHNARRLYWDFLPLHVLHNRRTFILFIISGLEILHLGRLCKCKTFQIEMHYALS